VKQTKASMDWKAVHRRIEAVSTALEGGLSPEDKKRVLRARARALARETEKRETRRESLEVVEFLLGDERYGVETAYVREVYPLRDLAAVPCTPAFVLGITNVRGKIVSVLDIRKFFDLPQKGLTELDKIIILENGRMELGVRADVILGVRSVPLDGLQSLPPTLSGIRERYLRGVTGEPTAILDVEKLLSDKRIIVHEELNAKVGS